MPFKYDLTGKRFGRLVVVSKTTRRCRGGGNVVWRCRCTCGGYAETTKPRLENGFTVSCGCYRRELKYKHGMRFTREWRIWRQMKSRCLNVNNVAFKRYGGRGIRICKRWRDCFSNFYADMGKCPPGYSIDRINNNGNYTPSNCRWATQSQQMNNTRRNPKYKWRGKLYTAKQLSKFACVSYDLLHHRLKDLQWPVQKSLYTSIKRK